MEAEFVNSDNSNSGDQNYYYSDSEIVESECYESEHIEYSDRSDNERSKGEQESDPKLDSEIDSELNSEFGVVPKNKVFKIRTDSDDTKIICSLGKEPTILFVNSLLLRKEKYFEALFNSGMKESIKQNELYTIEITDFDYSIVEYFLHNLYCKYFLHGEIYSGCNIYRDKKYEIYYICSYYNFEDIHFINGYMQFCDKYNIFDDVFIENLVDELYGTYYYINDFNHRNLGYQNKIYQIWDRDTPNRLLKYIKIAIGILWNEEYYNNKFFHNILIVCLLILARFTFLFIQLPSSFKQNIFTLIFNKIKNLINSRYKQLLYLFEIISNGLYFESDSDYRSTDYIYYIKINGDFVVSQRIFNPVNYDNSILNYLIYFEYFIMILMDIYDTKINFNTFFCKNLDNNNQTKKFFGDYLIMKRLLMDEIIKMCKQMGSNSDLKEKKIDKKIISDLLIDHNFFGQASRGHGRRYKKKHYKEFELFIKKD